MSKWLVIYGVMAVLVTVLTMMLAIYNTKKVEGYVTEESTRWIAGICLGAGIFWPVYFALLFVTVMYDGMKVIIRMLSR